MWELHQGHKQRRIKHTVLAFMVLVILISASSSMPFTPDNGAAHQQGQRKQSMEAPEMDSKEDSESVKAVVGEETCKELGTLGSRPPNCEYKCKRCIPCQAIQVPTTSDHLGIEVANYEPEGWKCKCGNSYFNP